MRMSIILGRCICAAAALSLAVPTMVQATAPVASATTDPPLIGVAPEGREIPADEADQLRGGKIKIALVIVKEGRRQVMRLISCSSSSACRNEAFQRFGKKVVEAVITDISLSAAQRQACRLGFSLAC